MNTPVSLSEIRTAEHLEQVSGVPILLRVNAVGRSAVDWAGDNKTIIQQHMNDHGALLLRGLKIMGSEQFGHVLSTLFGEPLSNYTYRSTPRTAFRGNVYTATEYPANEAIPQHNENSYSRQWPNRIGFYCMLPPQSGGATPIGSSRAVYELIPAKIRDRFRRTGVTYVRNYSTIDLPWQVVFQTSNREEVEAYCASNEIRFEWIGENGLRTSQTNAAIIKHPTTGEEVWFNQAHLFHISSLGSDLARTLIESLGEENVPRNTFYGDGQPIEEEVLSIIRAAYESTKIRFPWERNDILLLDNVRFTHGREPYVGPRKVLTGMACLNS